MMIDRLSILALKEFHMHEETVRAEAPASCHQWHHHVRRRPQALDELTLTHPELKKHLYSEEGKLRSFVNVYLNDEDIRYLSDKENTPVKEGDNLSIIPSIAGGSSHKN